MSNFFKKTKDVLGMNERNFSYLKPYNFKTARQNADDKLRTKELLEEANIPVAKTYGVICDQKELYDFDFESLPKGFVIKPNMGLGGGGIKIIFGRKKNNNWVGSQNSEVSREQILFHINDILDGHFSLTHAPDIAFFEQRLQMHPSLKLYSYKGIPDIRVIIFNKIPIMAMLRLPTKQSSGKANLMLGGIGVGVDISSGITTYAVQKNKIIGDKILEHIPGTRIPLRGIKLPFWQEILEMSINASDAVGLGFAGVDIALDKEMGPVVLEVNARPGLSIQNANLATLSDRLRRVKGLEVKTSKKGIKIAKELFGGEVQQELEEISGKRILGIIEKVKLVGLENEKKEIKVKVDTGAASTSLDMELARQLGFDDAIDYAKKLGAFDIGDKNEKKELYTKIKEEMIQHEKIIDVDLIHNSNGSSIRIAVEIEFMLGKQLVKSRVNIMDRAHMLYPMIIGRRDLKNFLIDPTKNFTVK